MPLPVNPSLTWPPACPERNDLTEWSSWYSGDPAALAGLRDPFTGLLNLNERTFNTNANYRFWARQARRTADSSDPAGVHVPVAGEIAQVSSDLLFGTFPAVACPPDEDGDETGPRDGLTKADAAAAQGRLEDLIVDAGCASTFREAAEVCAALGGVYLKVSWDTAFLPHPFITTVHADRAVPEWRYDRLYAVTFWRDLDGSGHGPADAVWRHLERHEPGVILHGLYRGTAKTLGVRVNMDAHPGCAGIPEEVILPPEFPFPLTVEYVPNVKPHRKFRGLPIGRADIAGSEMLLESLDETYSSWMRDIVLGKGRIVVPASALEPEGYDLGQNTGFGGRGGGMRFNPDRAVYDGLNLDPNGEGQGLTVAQFKIRTDEHAATATGLLDRIVSGSGYAPQTFGLHLADGRATSGTALRIREGRTFSTLARKQGYWEPATSRLLAMMLAVDAFVFGRPTPVTVPVLTWQDGRDGDTLELAQTLNMLSSAKAASVETRVRMAQPGLDEDQVQAEVARIFEDETRGTALMGPVPDPTAYPSDAMPPELTAPAA